MSPTLRAITRVLLLLAAIPLVFFLLCVPVWLYSYCLRIDPGAQPPPPGTMVDIGTHALHINCAGAGSPTIVLEAGGSGWSAHWTAVRNLLPDDVRVCAYDRAGLGWSERGPNPRNAKVIAAELSRLLENAGEKPPYLLVGHSFGGTVALSFMGENPGKVAGFVAVEVPTYKFMKWRRDTRTFILGGSLRQAVAPLMSVLATTPTVLSAPDMEQSPYNRFSDVEKAAVRHAGFRARMISTQLREDPYVASIEPRTDFGSLPVVVIQGAASFLASAEWDQNQQELLAMSSDSTLILVETAGHGVPSQAPEAIVEGIDWIRTRMR